MLNDKYRRLKALMISNKDYDSTFKPGDTAKITFKVKQNGKTYNLSCKIYGKEMPSQFKKFMIGPVNYASACKGKANLTINKPEGSAVKIKYTSAKGYKIESIYAYYTNSGLKKVKNGAQISTKDLTEFFVTYSVKNL